MPPDIRHTINDPEMIELLNRLGNKIGNLLPEGWGFNLLLFEFGGPGKNLFYISNAKREDIAKVMKEWIERRGM